MTGCAFDANGNLYVVGIGSAGNPSGTEASVIEVSGKDKHKSAKNLNNTDVVTPGNIEVTSNGDYLVLDTAAQDILEFKPASNVLVAATSLNGASEARSFALRLSEGSFWLVNDGGGGAAQLYNFPKGGSPKKSFPISSTSVGIALTPEPMP